MLICRTRVSTTLGDELSRTLKEPLQINAISHFDLIIRHYIEQLNLIVCHFHS